MRQVMMAASAACALSGCGGGGETVSQALPMQLLPDQIADDSAPEVSRLLGDRRQLLVDVSPTLQNSEQLQRNASYDVPGFKAFGLVNSNVLLWQSGGASGKAELSKYLNTSYISSPLGANAQTFFGTIPTAGTATYDGKYVGMLTANYGSTLYGSPTQSYMTGDVMLSADFGAGTVAGEINNRKRYRLSDSVFLDAPTDIVLAPLDMENGRSSLGGTTTGGEYKSRSHIDVPMGGAHAGNWNVAFGGPEAAEAFGRVQVDHDYDQSVLFSDPNDYTEVGVFEAAKQ